MAFQNFGPCTKSKAFQVFSSRRDKKAETDVVLTVFIEPSTEGGFNLAGHLCKVLPFAFTKDFQFLVDGIQFPLGFIVRP